MIVKRLLDYVYSKMKPKYAKKIGVEIGEGCSILSTNFGSEPWLISIGNHCQITAGVKFITHDGATWVFRDEEKYKNVIRYGRIVIKENCFIGMDAMIMPGVTIGPNAIVGAKALVTKDVPPGTIVGGVPAKVIGNVEDFAEKCLAETPGYDMAAYKKDKKAEIFKMLAGRTSFGPD